MTDQRSEAYFDQDRIEMLPLVPAGARRILDVGCGAGAFGALLRQRLGAEVWGVEPDAEACVRARARLDRVFQSRFDDALDLGAIRFDCICFNDVLEHMIDPDCALEKARAHLVDGGVVVASIPNFRYFPNLWEILRYGEFEYKPSGILDSTHLRFFTRKSMIRLFERAGYRVVHAEGIAPFRPWKLRALLLFSGKLLADTQYQAYALVARRG
jgi:SAM-dependent methyltransferase